MQRFAVSIAVTLIVYYLILVAGKFVMNEYHEAISLYKNLVGYPLCAALVLHFKHALEELQGEGKDEEEIY